MNIPRLLVTIVVAFVVMSAYNFVAHGVFLGSAYSETADAWRPMDEMMSRLWLQYLCFFMISVGFSTLWALAFPGKGVKCGAIFGFLVALMTMPGMMLNFVHYPTPDRFVIPWFVIGLLGPILMGVVVALVYKPKVTG